MQRCQARYIALITSGLAPFLFTGMSAERTMAIRVWPSRRVR